MTLFVIKETGSVSVLFVKMCKKQIRFDKMDSLIYFHKDLPPKDANFDHFPVCMAREMHCFENTNVNVELKVIKKVGDTIYIGILVKNICFEKEVNIRFSSNEWVTWEDKKAEYIFGTGEFDFFMARLTSYRGQRILFAVEYKVQSCVYWDNNFGKNYTVYEPQRERIKSNDSCKKWYIGGVSKKDSMEIIRERYSWALF